MSFRQSSEVICDKNEKIWGGNLSLSPISGIVAFDYDCDDLARGFNSLLQDKERKKDAMARLTDEEFRAWCQHNKIEPQTEAYIQLIRTSEPERRVHSRASNVSGRYPSVKMGCSIQFESQHVELWGIYTMERDSDVLEMYDQPTRIQLRY